MQFFNPLSHVAENLAAGGYKSAPAARKQVDRQEILNRTAMRADAAKLEVNGEMGAIMLAIFTDIDNIYVTGGAGTGKTTFLKHVLIPELEHRGLNYHITASTGIAGTHVDGKTLHSFLGIGLGPEWPPGMPILNMEREDIHRIYESTYQRWQNNPRIPASMREGLTRKLMMSEVILLEEVSMISGWGLLGYVDFFLKKVRNKPDKPFGGIQMIFVGDMGQLPPVEKYPGHRPDWAFMCDAWVSAKVRPMKFTKIHRQKEGWFTDFLNQTRDGIPVSPANLAHLRHYLIPNANPTSHPNFTFLCATNKEADFDNRCALDQYPGPTVEAKAVFDVREDQLRGRETIDEVKKRLIDSKTSIREVLHLRVGLPVLLTVNSPVEGYVNGTKGFVHKLVFDRTDPSRLAIVEVRVPNSKWSQRARAGMTAEERERVETYDTIHAIGVRYWSRSSSEDPDEIEPIDPVQYAKDLSSGVVPIPRHRYPVVGQFPIIPASAITIHKSQGMSLDDVVVRVDRAFAAGQVYVALSRLRSPDGLVITSMDMPIFADPSAAAFNQTVRSESADMTEATGKLAPRTFVVTPSPEGGPIRGKSCSDLIVDDTGVFESRSAPETRSSGLAIDVELDDDDIPY
jgi:ATP-dependent DNA helicase PIF1